MHTRQPLAPGETRSQATSYEVKSQDRSSRRVVKVFLSYPSLSVSSMSLRH